MKPLVHLLPILLLIGLLAACGTNQGDGSSPQQKQSSEHHTENNADFPVTLKDALGNKITIKEKPKRIVSLIPSNTEIAFALGAGDRMVGVSKFSDYPKEVKNIDKIGGQKFNVEKILSLKPDLVLAFESNAKNDKEGLDQMRKAGIKVVVVRSASSFNDVYASMKTIGKATGTTDKADEVVGQMKSDIADIKKKTANIPKKDRVKVWAEVAPPPDVYTTGSGTFMNEMLDIIHAKNIAANEKGWVKYSPEKAVKQRPDVVVLTYGGGEKAVNKVLHRDGWQNVPAVKNKRVHAVDDDLVSRSGPRLTKGVKELAKAVYPDVFKD